LDHDALHRHFWRRRGERNRLAIKIADLADSLGVSYDIANQVVIDMRDEGRIRAVAWQKVRVRVYQISDPRKWRKRRPSTHAQPNKKPVWG
jgi:hypothetical protein